MFFLCAYACVLLVPAETSGAVLLCFLLAGSPEYLRTSPANPVSLSTCQPGSRFRVAGDHHCKIKRLLSELFCLCSLHLGPKKTEACSESRRESEWESDRLRSQKSIVTPWLAIRGTPQTAFIINLEQVSTPAHSWSESTAISPKGFSETTKIARITRIHFVSAKDRQNTLAGVCVAFCPSATSYIIIFITKIGMIPKMSITLYDHYKKLNWIKLNYTLIFNYLIYYSHNHHIGCNLQTLTEASWVKPSVSFFVSFSDINCPILI